MSPKLVISLIVAVLALIILLQNTQMSQIDVLFWGAEMSQAILVLLVLVLGFVLGFTVAKLHRGRSARRKTPTKTEKPQPPEAEQT